MDILDLFTQLGIALGLGILVGLQREKTSAEIAGVRTFPLITVFGTMSAWLAQQFGPWILAASILSLAALVVLGNVYLMRTGHSDGGLTSEIAILVMFATGALLAVGPRPVAIAIGGGVAVLLHAKESLHGFANRLEGDDLRAIMRFALIALVILPILPDRPFGPFDVLNLRAIWWMVVLIVGISLGGFILYRFVDRRTGAVLGGIFGGIISSTATTVSYAKLTRRNEQAARLSATVVAIANAVVMIRVLIEIWIVGPALLPVALGPIVIMLIVQILLAAFLVLGRSPEEESLLEPRNPAELRPALVFAALYAVVLVGVAATRHYLGNEGLYAVAVISGLTDVDAITLSTARLAQVGRLELGTAWRLIILATMANLVFKTAIVALLGNRRMLRTVAALSAISIAAGGVLLLLWPA
ncbi:MAG TPA: MgtC/SapB family protein [Thermoanaerobaculia bacterium]|nr:MgtC/SapB family protein [Thermoanaerobaculia bacterium]